jgi:tetratricopeptide (TPR) repeat protein
MSTPYPKELPEPTMSDRILETFIVYKKQIITVFVLICLSAGGVLLWMQKTKADRDAASTALARVTPWIQAGQFDKAINGEGSVKGLQSIISTWGNTPGGNMARLYLASIWFTSGKPDAALTIYKGFTSDNKDLQASAIAGAAACLGEKKDFAKAAPEYEKASETAENESLKAMYLNKGAESYAAAAQPDMAAKLLEKVIKTWPGTSSAGIARRTLWRLAGEGVPVPQL